MEHVPYSHLSKGTLLIASPDIDKGVYFRSVILLCDHSTIGSFGLIINKPVAVEFPNDLLATEELNNKNIKTLNGGPLQGNQMMLLHNTPNPNNEMLNVCDDVHLGGDLEFLQASAMDPNGPPILLCFGYSGWNGGQLEKEFLNGDWFLHKAKSEHLFSIPPEKLWQTALREMGGKYASLSMIPEDLSLN